MGRYILLFVVIGSPLLVAQQPTRVILTTPQGDDMGTAESPVTVASSSPTTNRTASGTLGAVNNAVTINAQGAGATYFFIPAGQLNATLTLEATLDDTTWFTVRGIDMPSSVSAPVNWSTTLTALTQNRAVIPGGFSQVRVRVSSYSSGSVTGYLEATASSPVIQPTQMIPLGDGNSGSTVNPPPVAAFPFLYNGINFDRWYGSSTNGGRVDLRALGGTALGATNPFHVRENRAATSTHTNTNDAATSATILASNANRVAATCYNDSTQILYLKLGATASTTSFTAKVAPDTYYEVPRGWTGVIDGIWAADAAGASRCTELTP